MQYLNIPPGNLGANNVAYSGKSNETQRPD